MHAAFEKLKKFLTLEQKQGYQNRAVIGGLEGFAEVWRAEAQDAVSDEVQAQQVSAIANLLAGYASAERGRRERDVEQILNQLEEVIDTHVDADSARTDPAVVPSPHKPTPRKAAPPLEGGAVAQSAAAEAAGQRPSRPGIGLDAPVSALPGISSTYSNRLLQLGITTVGDLLYHFPHRYDDYSSLKTVSHLEYGEETTVIGVIWETNSSKSRGGGSIVKTIIADASGTIEAVWFNQPYLARQLKPGRRIVLSGKVDEYLGRLTLQSPAWEPLEAELIHTGRLVPIYPLTKGITSRWMRRMLKRVVDHWAPRLEDPLPQATRERLGLPDLPTALRQMHFPDTQESADRARDRLAFDEFLTIQLGLLQKRREWKDRPGVPIPRDGARTSAFLESLPFRLTQAQHSCLEQISDDLAEPQPMSRLLQGDVGSGKTVVAAAAMLQAIAAGKQVALMAPTEILAAQHHRTITELFDSSTDLGLAADISVVLLTGSKRRVERGKIYAAVASGEADIIVGTHALIQRHVTFQDLGLVIVDEQHRFGVAQRATLRSKGISPHMLVMSATPIPRSLALTLFGDLDISVIDELPPGRTPIQTRWLLPKERERAYAFIRSQIEKGRQAFFLYPLIQESGKVEAKAAVEEYERLTSKIFPDLRLGLLHGRMKSKEKDRTMTSFREGQIDILVSTSVIEVGIDVPNATVMLVEGADRFGLAQLHQFRGRVGRGPHKSFCLLLSDTASPDDPQTRTTWERLKAIEELQDGFALAEKDLELRGPGDFLGVRQSGLPELRLARLSNVKNLELARTEAQSIFREDPALDRPEHALLEIQVRRAWQGLVDLS